MTLVAPPTLLPVGVDDWPVHTSYDLDGALDSTLTQLGLYDIAVAEH